MTQTTRFAVSKLAGSASYQTPPLITGQRPRVSSCCRREKRGRRKAYGSVVFMFRESIITLRFSSLSCVRTTWLPLLPSVPCSSLCRTTGHVPRSLSRGALPSRRCRALRALRDSTLEHHARMGCTWSDGTHCVAEDNVRDH